MHIAVTSLWILPVIRSSALVRVAYMIASAALQVSLSYWFYFDWVHTGGIDGGAAGLSVLDRCPRSSARWPATP